MFPTSSNHWNFPLPSLPILGTLAASWLLAQGAAAQALNFEEHVKPIVRAQCIKCHNPDKAKGGLDMSSLDALLKGGGSGPVVRSGDGDGSRLVRCMTHDEEPFMPPNASKRPDDEINTIRKWINDGLIERAGGAARKAAPANELKLAVVSVDKPDGPPPMPVGLPIESVTVGTRPGPVVAMAASPWAPLVAIGGDKQVLLYHTETQDLLGVLAFPEGMPHVIKFSRNGKLLLCGGGVGAASGRVAIWDVVTGQRVATVGDELDAVLAADLSADHSLVALGGSDKLVKIYSVADGQLVRKIKKHTEWITAIEFSPDGVLLATADRNGGVVIWETQSGQEYQVLAGHTAAVTGMSWRRDSNVLATSGEDGSLRLWNADDGAQVRTWVAHKEGALSVHFAANGRLVSSGRDKAARVWDAAGKELKAIKDFQDLVLQVAFTSDGRQIVIGDWTGKARVTDADSATLLGELDVNPGWIADRIESTAEALQRTLEERTNKVDALAKADVAAKVAGDATAQKRKENEEAAAALQAAEQALAQATKNQEQTQAALAAAQAEAGGRAKRRADLETARQAEEKKLADAKAALAAAEGEGPALQKAATEARNAADAARARAAEAAAKRTALAQADAKAKEAADALAAAMQKINPARAEVERLTAVVAAAAAEVKPAEEQKLAAARNVLQAAESELPPKQQAANDTKAAAEQARAALQGVPDEAALQTAIAQADTATGAASALLTTAQQKSAAAKSEVDRLAGTLAQAVAAAADGVKSDEEGRQGAAGKSAQVDAAKAALADSTKKRDEAKGRQAATAQALAAAEEVSKKAYAAADEAQRARNAVERRLAVLDKRLMVLKAAQLDVIVTAASERISAKGGTETNVAGAIKLARTAVGKMDVPKPVEPKPKVVETPRKTNPAMLFLGRYHFVVLHFPIALLVVACLLEFARLFRHREWVDRSSLVFLRLGAGTAVVTAILGWLLAANGNYDESTMTAHRWLGVAAAVAAVSAAILRSIPHPIAFRAYLTALLATVCTVSSAGHFGGSLTHGEGFLTQYLPQYRAALSGQATEVQTAGVYGSRIQPILESSCYPCHNDKKAKGKYRLDLREVAFKGGSSGETAIVPGEAMKSELVRRLLLPHEHEDAMPPDDKPALKPEDILAIVHWINEGADWPDLPVPVQKPDPTPAKKVADAAEKKSSTNAPVKGKS